MAARIPLAKSLAAGANGASKHVRIADPPFLFVTNSGWTGTVAIQHSASTFPPPAQSGQGDGVSDADADWDTIVTLNPSDEADWPSPLYRVRVNGTGILTGTPNVYMLENIRRTKKKDR
jgi:hypothetical protein